MTLDEIKRINIREYLQSKGIDPYKSNDRNGMYHSPFREDKDASLKVDYNKNLWIDYGTGRGGSIIDLVSQIENCSISEAINKLEKGSFSFHRNNASIPEKQESAITIRKIQPLSNPALLNYLKERQISTDIAALHCEEVYYFVNDKPYFAIGFKNDAGGHELRNKYFKGCTSKDVTHIKKGTDTCLLFEGFIDYLSYLTIKNIKQALTDTIVLNSLTNLSKVKTVLAEYRGVIAFLDNDETGKQSIKYLRSFCKEVLDQSVHYANYKDLNDYWQTNPNQKSRVAEIKADSTIKRQIPVKKRGYSME